MTRLGRAVKERLGLKERVLTRCRGGHVYRVAYGDERLWHSRYQCEFCPAHTDEAPSRPDIVVDYAAARVREFRRRRGNI